MLAMRDGMFDRGKLDNLERTGGVALMAKVIDQFLEKVPLRMDDACERGRAGDLGGLGRAIRSIGSAAGNVGATEVSDMAGRINRLAEAGAKDVVLPCCASWTTCSGMCNPGSRRKRTSTYRAGIEANLKHGHL